MTAQEFFCNVWLAGISLKRLPAPKSKTFIPRSPCLQRLVSDKGKWVNYQIRLRGLTQKEIAARAGCSQSQVANTLAGRTSSSKIYLVLCDILEISSIAELLATPRRSAT